MPNLITEFGRGKVVWRACDLRSRVAGRAGCAMETPAWRRLLVAVLPWSSCWHILHRYLQLIRLPLYACKLLPWVKTRLQEFVGVFITPHSNRSIM